MSKEPKHSLLKNQEPVSQETKTSEIVLQDAKRPTNLPANATPVDGYVLSVDGKFKLRYENSEDAMAAGTKLKQTYPVIQVAIYDAAARSYTPIK